MALLTSLKPESFPGLWGLVNNAGIAGSHIGPLDWLNADDHREVFNVNYFGMVNVTNVFLPLIKKEKGRIVNVASILGKMSMESMGPYVASKHAVEAFSDVLRWVHVTDLWPVPDNKHLSIAHLTDVRCGLLELLSMSSSQPFCSPTSMQRSLRSKPLRTRGREWTSQRKMNMERTSSMVGQCNEFTGIEISLMHVRVIVFVCFQMMTLIITINLVQLIYHL